ncbi:MAG: hypothetical protein FWE20_02440 [Defluviitaleaceae bacterium]|nr:hypothetical protein [Defluviitaleaceae bacterium]
MMPKNILRSLFNGEFSAWERRPIRTEENKTVHRKIEDENRYFIQKMSIDDGERFQKLENLYTYSNEFEQEDAFAYGFRLAAMLMCAVFMSDGEPTSKCSE